MELFDKIQEAASFIKKEISCTAHIGIILGSGLSDLSSIVSSPVVIPYTDIPHFPVSTVHGHKGQLVCGQIEGKDVILMAGRFHYYEGYTMKDVTFPIRVMKALGINTLIISNAAGGVNTSFSAGDLMLITDHINLLPENPLRGTNDERLGIRFPNMTDAYNKKLILLAKEIAREKSIHIREGIYVGLQGPSFETPAEYKMMRTIGADAVGMSTVPEVIVARHAGMEVFAMSVICNMGIQDTEFEVTHDEVLDAAKIAAPKMAAIVTGIIGSM